MVYGVKIFITPEDILNKLPEEDRKKVNCCAITDVSKNNDSSIDISCILFWDEDKSIYEANRRYRYCSDEKIPIE